ncbi:Pimeloyl-ACP methyl ester carboxylesterase [Micromonospora pattaloongensis]|uniref:Pimeloyl-ACP methyl ester carboxylesterase n=1 Tax=Micromonospora pattaloongensis TaxID=405436 RepID=A0A1H3LLM9_9ACTN|nr:alpha/beta hydrolase [Micromonospora pattaloongensis]SDY65447.1 Pimeloyl-ACP methyl ester carboxylesterase [Micromonospora pattaloongensis]
MGTAFLEVPGGRLAYEATGPADGPLVVCAHGMGDTRASYRFLTPALVAAGHRVVTVDLRGHGKSSSGWPAYSARLIGEDLLALIRHLGGRATLIAHSISCASAVWAAAEAPDAITRLTLIGPFVEDAPMNPAMRLATAAVLRSPRLWTMYYRSLYPSAKPADFADYLRALRATLGEPGRMAAVRGLMGTGPECMARIPEVRCPVQIVMGTKDPDFADPTAAAREAERRFARATAELVEGAGHYPHAELPALTTPTVRAFVAEPVSA